MDARIFIEPQQGADYATQLACAQTAERLGFDGFFRSDHYLAMPGQDGLPGPTDSWITLAGLARETSSIRLGTLVSAATFRAPGPMAITVAQVDEMSGGRVELGLGTGWFREEHEAYGLPFPDDRFARFEEQLQIITGLWSTPVGERFSYAGEHWTLSDSPALPKPTQNPVPIIIGGGGKARTPRLAAEYASEFNIGFQPEAVIADRFAAVRRAAEKIDRDPDSLVYSVALATIVGTDERDYARRVESRGLDPVAFRENTVSGTVAEALEKIARIRELGATRIYLQTRLAQDLDLVELLGAEVLPHLRGL
ncbi:LLM class F420-dependent oxidoreductase [Schumannella luteola]|uniref:F420-dependent oxidoreductase-like protein n=1 Tax=Schumannella luteola TaxID=472059 RepID=A0A852Y8P2_9MICO|nr:LLM class F420-dependent oxidoreductase [Schumannella luteola]NYG97674.1 F420-dependent oxidoreductase-like protein [Schumannella luteola]TPX01451.1 LLM class F420-dependent oxidoreductase [Schumannella luteola]